MKFKFKIQQYQTDAVERTVEVFEGQPSMDSLTYRRDLGKHTATLYDDELEMGYRNSEIQLLPKEILANIRKAQTVGDIKLSDSLVPSIGACSLDIEMETGTGKTYVYIKTMFELNKRYGWSKFIVVVPSIAIREGVKKSFEITSEHFMEHYGKKARFFVYNSANLNQLDSFSSSSGINVMIINTQAFASSLKEDGKSKEARIIYSKRDEFASRRPIDVIKANRPIIILDEPTVGLDPLQIIEIRDLIKELGRDHTVILSSHILTEINTVCDKIMIVRKGKLVACDTPDNLTRTMLGEASLSLTVDPCGKKLSALSEIEGVLSFDQQPSQQDEGCVELTISHDPAVDIRRDVFRAVAELGCVILSMQEVRHTLEDIFLELTNSESVPAEAEAEVEAEPSENA